MMGVPALSYCASSMSEVPFVCGFVLAQYINMFFNYSLELTPDVETGDPLSEINGLYLTSKHLNKLQHMLIYLILTDDTWMHCKNKKEFGKNN